MTDTREITNNQDYIDSRDIIARIEYLEGEETLEVYEQEELEALKKLTEEASSSEWKCGVTLINEDYFGEYAREFAEDIGAISRDTDWPAACIDWEWAARELRMDYTEIEFDGVSYLFR